jgi:hypothetical protein
METDKVFTASSRVFDEVLKEFRAEVRLVDAGSLIYLNGGIARLSGLPNVQSNERVIAGPCRLAARCDAPGGCLMLLLARNCWAG